MTAAEAKRWLRRCLVRQRQALGTHHRKSASRSIMKALIATPAYRRAKVVASYIGFGSEVQTDGLIEHAWRSGKKVLVPVSSRGFRRPHFVLFSKGDRLAPTRFGPMELVEKKKPFDFRRIDLVIVPGLAFDDQGHRLGYGGGVYDRMLAKAARSTRIGLFFSDQRMARLPSEAHDRRLHAVVTERGAEMFK